MVMSRPDPAPIRPAADVEVATFVATDATGNGHDGIIQGPVEVGQPGHEGSAYSFAERGSWVMVPSSPELNAGTGNFLVTTWIKVESAPDEGETYDIVRKGIAYTVPGEYKLELLGSGRVRCTAKDSENRLATVVSQVVLGGDGTWHRIGCARTGRHWSVLVDETIRSAEVDLGAVSNTVALAIGSKYGLEDRPLGLVDDVRLVIDRSGGETNDPVAAIHELEERPPIAWWRLDEAAKADASH
jgi:hypothetical protein